MAWRRLGLGWPSISFVALIELGPAPVIDCLLMPTLKDGSEGGLAGLIMA